MRAAWAGTIALLVGCGCGGKSAPTAPQQPSVVPQEVVLAIGIEGDGTVRAQGQDCRAACTERFAKGTKVSLQAVPDQGANFAGFSGACTGQTCDLTLDADAAVGAHFTRPPPPPAQHQLTVQVDGHGSVRSSPSGIDCGNACSASFLASAQVALTPMPDAGFSFSGWNGVCIGNGACIVMMSDDAHVIAKFDPLPAKMVSVTITVTGPGKVTGGGLDCPGTACAIQVAQGSTVSMHAAPNPGARLTSWSQAGCSGA